MVLVVIGVRAIRMMVLVLVAVAIISMVVLMFGCVLISIMMMVVLGRVRVRAVMMLMLIGVLVFTAMVMGMFVGMFVVRDSRRWAERECAGCQGEERSFVSHCFHGRISCDLLPAHDSANQGRLHAEIPLLRRRTEGGAEATFWCNGPRGVAAETVGALVENRGHSNRPAVLEPERPGRGNIETDPTFD